MEPKVSIIMGSTSDLPVMEKAAKILDEFAIPFEMNALSAHRTPSEVEKFAKGAKGRGIKVIVAAAGMAAHLPGVIASMTTLPVIGVPINASLDGMDALLAIVQMPPGIPVATVGINGAMNAGLLAIQMLAIGDETISAKLENYKEQLKSKIIEAKSIDLLKPILFAILINLQANAFCYDRSIALGGRAEGMAGVSVARADFWSIYNNQAGLAEVENFTIGAYNKILFGTRLGLKALGLVKPTKSGALGFTAGTGAVLWEKTWSQNLRRPRIGAPERWFAPFL